MGTSRGIACCPCRGLVGLDGGSVSTFGKLWLVPVPGSTTSASPVSPPLKWEKIIEPASGLGIEMQIKLPSPAR